jgi:hypothetical protein
MKIEVKRFEYATACTISKMYIDGEYQCYVLEDKMREIDGAPVEQWKVQNETAIPKGTYKVIVTMSTRFKKELPLLLDVPGFKGVRIHTGNKSSDTEGCLLVGKDWMGSDVISNSRTSFAPFFAKLQSALQGGGQVSLRIGDSIKDFP